MGKPKGTRAVPSKGKQNKTIEGADADFNGDLSQPSRTSARISTRKHKLEEPKALKKPAQALKGDQSMKSKTNASDKSSCKSSGRQKSADRDLGSQASLITFEDEENYVSMAVPDHMSNQFPSNNDDSQASIHEPPSSKQNSQASNST